MGIWGGREDTRDRDDYSWGLLVEGLEGRIQGMDMETAGVDWYRGWEGGYKG